MNSAAERENAPIKDDFGRRDARVRARAKVLCHVMFGFWRWPRIKSYG